ncbi:MAG: vanillate O-demethylase oxidoreductase VanB, partial [Pseudohongiella sp.]
MNSQDKIVKTVDIKAPVSRVWQAISDYRQFGEWFRVKLNEPFVAGEKSTGAMTYPGYEGYEWLAIVETVEPESLLS